MNKYACSHTRTHSLNFNDQSYDMIFKLTTTLASGMANGTARHGTVRPSQRPSFNFSEGDC